MSKAAELAALIGSQSALSNRNLVINGAMQVAQRATSATFSTSSEGYLVTDRFAFSMNGTSTVYTASQDSTAPDGFSNSLKLDCTTADASLSAGDFTQLHYRIEGQDLQQLQKGTSGAKKVTISFYVRSPKTGTHILEIQDRDNTRSISKAYTVSTADTFEYKEVTFDGDTSGALNDDNGESFRLTWWLQAGSTYTSGTLATSWEATTSANRAVGQVNIGDDAANNFYITGIQMEVGEQATPFEHRSFGDEMTRCERYFQRFVANDAYTAWSVAFSTSATSAKAHLKYNCKMRAEPTISQSNTGFNHGPQVAFSSFNTLYTGLDLTWIDMNIGNVSAANVLGHWNANANTAAYVQMDAEL